MSTEDRPGDGLDAAAGDPRAPALACFAAVRAAYIAALRRALDEHTASATRSA